MTTQLSPVEASIVFNEIPEIFLSQPRQVWLDRLIDADVAAIPVLRPGEVFDEPQAVHNKMVIELTDPVLGPIQQVAAPITFEQTPGAGDDSRANCRTAHRGGPSRASREAGPSDGAAAGQTRRSSLARRRQDP